MRRHRALALIAAWALVLARSVIFLRYEQSMFDSDQAIFGLMAKHILDGRAFPLFMYGQTYMLAVDAWWAVPFVFVLGPTVFALHASLVATNLAIVTTLMLVLMRVSMLAPWQALVAVVPFALAPPVTAGSLIEAAGNIGPFLYVPLLWILRKRPIAFGALFAFACLHREFSVYAVPSTLAVEALTGELWTRARLRSWVLAAVVAIATWQGVQALRPLADTMGPGTRGAPLPGGLGVGAVTERLQIAGADVFARSAQVWGQHFPGLVGAARADTPIARQGWAWLRWPFLAGLAVLVIAGAASVLGSRRERDVVARAAFPLYLAGVGVCAIASYIATRPVGLFLDRYMLLAIYLPVGLVALVFAAVPARWPRCVAVAVVVMLAVSSAIDHVHLAERYWGGRDPNRLRVLADALVARGTSIALAPYWRAYKLTYLTGERVKVASSDVIRIDEYQRLARAEGARLTVIQEKPCEGGTRIDVWYLCRRDAAESANVP